MPTLRGKYVFGDITTGRIWHADYKEMLAADDGNPALRKLVLKAVQEWKSKIASIVADGIESGEIRPDTEPIGVANIVIATMEGALMISRLFIAKCGAMTAPSILD